MTRVLPKDGTLWAKITFLFNGKRDPIIAAKNNNNNNNNKVYIVNYKEFKEIRQFIRCNPLKHEIQVNNVLKIYV